MNILTDTSGEWHFLDKDYKDVFFTNWNDIPEDFEFSHVIKFKPTFHQPLTHQNNIWRLKNGMAD